MDGIRLKKIESLLTEDLSEMFRRFTKENMPGVMISVSKVSVTPDLAAARVWLSMFPVGDKESLLKQLKSMTPQFRGELGNKVRHQLRKVPELEFFIDDSIDYIETIDRELRGEGENPIRK